MMTNCRSAQKAYEGFLYILHINPSYDCLGALWREDLPAINAVRAAAFKSVLGELEANVIKSGSTHHSLYSHSYLHVSVNA